MNPTTLQRARGLSIATHSGEPGLTALRGRWPLDPPILSPNILPSSFFMVRMSFFPPFGCFWRFFTDSFFLCSVILMLIDVFFLLLMFYFTLLMFYFTSLMFLARFFPLQLAREIFMPVSKWNSFFYCGLKRPPVWSIGGNVVQELIDHFGPVLDLKIPGKFGFVADHGGIFPSVDLSC